MTTVNWGMIGCGDVTERKSAPAFGQVAGSKLIAVSSRTFRSAQDYAARHGVALVFEDPLELIRSPHVDAVYLATPPSPHLELAQHVAAAGKPCCVEKPIALTHADAISMVDAFKAAKQPLFVSYYRRSLPRFNQVKQWLADGSIGQVRHVHWSLTRTPSAADLAGKLAWRVDPEEAPGGYFEDLACHGLDLFDYLIDPIAKAVGVSSNQQGLYPVPDAVSAAWQHDGGATGSGYWNFAASAPSDEVEIIGSKGSVRFSIFEESSLIIAAEGTCRTIKIPNPDPIQIYHVENMMQHLSGAKPHPSMGMTAARTALVMDQIFGRAG